jgi:Domain of unknown function (DUF932)
MTMKTGKSLIDLATEIQRQSEAKKDFVADTDLLSVATYRKPAAVDADALPPVQGYLYVGKDRADAPFLMTKQTHAQIAAHTGVPHNYYQRMLQEAPELWQSNVQHWFDNEVSRRMVRTLDGTARAFLSDRYYRLDNDDVAAAALPVLLEKDDIKVVSADITETRLYIKALFPRVEAEVARGDVVQAGVVISNSEIGHGALSVSPLIYRLVCTNGMIAPDHAFKRHHLGRRVGGENGDDLSIYRDETLAADDKALLMKLQDVIRSCTGLAFTQMVDKLRVAAGGVKMASPIHGVEVLAKTLNLTKTESEGVLERIIRGGDYSRYGALNAVTNLANDVADYDRATELETLGGTVLELPANQWRRIAEAA